MKKIMMTAMALAVLSTANAQEGKWYGSKQGGFAITFNANPVLKYVGNMFNGTQNNSLDDFEGVDGKNLFSGTTITGKYFLKDNIALDLGFGFNNDYDVTNIYGSEDLDKVTSYRRVATTAFHFKGGVEYRLQAGKRLQPIFGADVVFQHTNSWKYNAVTDGDNNGDHTYAGNPTNSLGLMLNAGVEYFIVPQISLGANLSFGVNQRWERESKDNNPEGEGIGKNFSRVTMKNTDLKTGNVGANVTLNFYF